MEKVMEYILQVEKYNSFSKAAESLFISQPALSAIIHKEEQRLNTKLFDRQVKPIKVTRAGELYVEAAKKIKRIEDKLFKELAATDNEIREVVVGSSAFFFVNFINQIIKEYNEKHPEISFKCMEYSTEEGLKMLQKREVDVVITAHGNHIKKCSFAPIKSESIVLAVPAAYEINKHLSGYAITLKDINSGKWLKDKYSAVPLNFFGGYPFILHKKSKDMYRRAMRMFHNKNMHPEIIGQIEDFYTLYFLARSGQGIVLLRDSLLKYMEPTSNLVFYKLDDVLSTRDINIYYRDDKISPMLQSFIDFCIKYEKQ